MAIGTIAFWQEIGKQLGILKDRSETDLAFCCRVMLSALSKWALTAAGGAEQVSILKVQQVIEEKLAGYLKLLPTLDTINPHDITEMIYELLLENGAFYHLQYNVRPALHKLIGCGDISFIRGMNPEEKVCFSGLAPFVMESSTEGNITDDFMLWALGGSETIDLVWRRSTTVESSVNLEEYLNIERTGGRYFTGKKNPSWPFTLARSRQPGNISIHEYYIITGNETRHIPSDYVEATIHEYVRLAMMNNVKKQTIAATISESIVSVECGYLLPAPDLRFMRYVSWPVNIADMKDAFRFLLHPAIWPGVRERLISLGYEVRENHD